MNLQPRPHRFASGLYHWRSCAPQTYGDAQFPHDTVVPQEATSPQRSSHVSGTHASGALKSASASPTPASASCNGRVGEEQPINNTATTYKLRRMFNPNVPVPACFDIVRRCTIDPMAPEIVDLHVGDLAVWTGKPNEYAPLSRRVIYQVIERKEPPEGSYYVQYRFRAVFDIENPIGTVVESTSFMTSREMKKLSLLDLGSLRLHFDNFIREWAKQVCGANIDDVR